MGKKVRIKNRVQGQPDQYMEVSTTGVVSFQPDKPNNARQKFEIEEDGADPDPPGQPIVLPPADSWKNARGSYLYSGTAEEAGDTQYWLAASRYLTWSRAKRLAYAKTQTGTHIVLACNTGNRPQLGEVFFDCLKNATTRQRVLSAIDDANADGFQVWGYLATQEHLEQKLGLPSGTWDAISDSQFDDLVGVLTNTLDVIKGRVHVVTPTREIGDKFSSDGLERRTAIMRALRGVSASVALFQHERSLEGVPVSDFAGVSLPHGSALQTGFGTDLAVAREFVKDNVDRMAQKLPGHRVIFFEGHIPPNVYSGSVTSHTLSQARARSQAIMVYSGAAGNMDSA